MAPIDHTTPSAPPVVGDLAVSFNTRPEWLRVKEACQYSRLSKPKLYQLLNAGRIKSVSLRERGQIRGTRLISFDSLRRFLESRAKGGEDIPSNVTA